MVQYVFLGIDPGTSGGMCCVCTDSIVDVESIEAVKMPEKMAGILDWICDHSPSCNEGWDSGIGYYAYLEKVCGYMPGSKGNIGSRMFTFGQSYGSLEMALVAAGYIEEATRYSYHTISPRTWQAEVGVEKRWKGESDSSWKGRLKARAANLYPSIRPTLHTADAILLAHCCRLRFQPSSEKPMTSSPNGCPLPPVRKRAVKKVAK